MKSASLLCFLVFVVQHYHEVNAAAQEVVLVRTQPDPGQLPCPQQTVELLCQILTPSLGLTWTLPSGEELEFGPLRDIGDVRNSSDGMYSANLTGRMEDEDPDTDRFLFNSTLLALGTVNGSIFTCSGGTGADPVEDSITITLSDEPDSPLNLSYDKTIMIEASVTLQWSRPTYTGGVPFMNYNITANGQTEPVTEAAQVVTYNATPPVYGNVAVSTINSCGQNSEPATLNIPAKAPPKVDGDISVVLACDMLLDRGVPATIKWTYGARENGVVYPGLHKVSVTLNRSIECFGTSTGAMMENCVADIDRGKVYEIMINQTNDRGSTIDKEVFNSGVVNVEEEKLTSDSLSLTVKIGDLCEVTEYSVIVLFGTRPVAGEICSGEKNATGSGNSSTFSVPANKVTLEIDEEYCYIVYLNGAAVSTGPEGGGTSTTPTPVPGSDGSGPNVALIAGVIGGVVVVLILILVVAIVVFAWHRHQKEQRRDDQELRAVIGSQTKESAAAETVDAPTYQDPNTISRTPHPTTGELYTEVQPGNKPRKNKAEEAGPMYQDPNTIEHETAASGDMYAMPQKKVKKGKKGKREEEPELTEEQTAALYSVPDRKGQKAKSEGLTYADLDIHTSAKKAPPSAGSTYVDIKYD